MALKRREPDVGLLFNTLPDSTADDQKTRNSCRELGRQNWSSWPARERGPNNNAALQLGFPRVKNKAISVKKQKQHSPHEGERPLLEQFTPCLNQGALSLPCLPPRRKVNTLQRKIISPTTKYLYTFSTPAFS